MQLLRKSRTLYALAGRGVSLVFPEPAKSKPQLIFAAVLPLLLAVFIPLSFAADELLPEDAGEGEAVSVMAFMEGYDSIIAELEAKEAGEILPSADPPVPKEEEVFFSLDSEGTYFFDTDQLLEIKTSKPGKVYYSFTGKAPDQQSGTLYTDPLPLPSGDNVKVYSIAAIAYFDDGTVSDVYYRSYFVGKKAQSKYDTLVFSILTDPDNLTSRERGILNPRNIWQSGRDWERPINVECFLPTGELLLSQKAGIRLFGAYSRNFNQKSLRIIARYDYDEAHNRFEYKFFDGIYSYFGTQIGEFKQLVLRNSGNDFGVAFMRDPLVQMLFAQQGYPFTESVRPCVVYINGKLYGFMWIHEPYKASYFEQRYGEYDYKGTFVVLQGGESSMTGFDQEYRALKPLTEYRKMYNYSRKDLTDDAVYAELCELLDVESYIQLYAAFAYVDNGDWPHNNNRAFRYFAAEGEDFSDVYGMDGKWYFLPHDTDFAFNSDVNANTLERNLKVGEIQYSPLFSALMKREDVRWMYVTYMLDMMNGAFSPANSERVVQGVINGIRNSIYMMHSESKYLPNNSDNASFERRAPRIINYLKQRGKVMVNYLQDKYNLGYRYTLSLSLPDGGAAYVNSLYVNKDFNGTYYENYDTVLRPVVPPGKAFSCWVVNGEEVYTPELRVRGTDVIRARVNVELRLADPEVPELSIYEVSYRGDGDYVLLYNNTGKTVSTLGYHLTDDPSKPDKYMMPVMYIEPGETVKVYFKSRTGSKILHSLTADFGLKDGETLVLSKKDPYTREIKTLDSVRLPKVEYGNVYRRNLNSGVFFEVSPETEGTGGLEVNRIARLPRAYTGDAE